MDKKDFGCNVFDRAKMKRYLAPWAFAEICRARNAADNCGISEKCVENFAKGVRKWAISRGATRFVHWFQPLDNFSAGKRDSLFKANSDGKVRKQFGAKELQSGEGDASSFPSGGLRQTFEARGIARWDFFSPPFVKDDCLFIPSTFESACGEALDKKTPLLRSLRELRKQTTRLMHICGFECAMVESFVGAEQEYFLLDRQKFLQRDDLRLTGRTLVGAATPKGQEVVCHYYRPPDEQTLNFWREVDEELWKLGIVVKTEHKEVAPRQFELVPCFAEANIACDRNQIVVHVLQSTAEKFGLRCLLHEKPFENFNGSGKHNNISLWADGQNLFEQGNTAEENARFVLFVAGVVRAADLHADLLRFSVASAANDCRLGGFEAPPQTISVFLGEIFEILTKILHSDWKMGVDKLPAGCALTDRNRTSPLAFTGNKFEFRTVGASANLCDCNTILNTVFAESLKFFADELQSFAAKPRADFWQKAKNLAKDCLDGHGKIVFCGNNYSKEWKAEAEKRGLPNISDTFNAAKCLSEPTNIKLFEKSGVLSSKEIAARQRVCLENYADTICLEARVTALCLKKILPAMQTYLKKLLSAESLLAESKAFVGNTAACEQNPTKDIHGQTNEVCENIRKIRKQLKILGNQTEKFRTLADAKQKAEFAATTLLCSMNEAKKTANKAEEICPPGLFPMPSCEELLF